MDARVHTTRYLFAALAVALMATAGCASATPDDEAPTEQPRQAAQEDVEQLAENPCSDPDWDEPPPEPVSLEEAEK